MMKNKTLNISELKKLTKIATEVRRRILTTASASRTAHIGSSLSAVEILTALYFQILNIRKKGPGHADRDRFILSKGHSALALYSVLVQAGIIPEKILAKYGEDHSWLSSHPDRNVSWGIEASTGSLGHGLSLATGLALAARQDNKKWRSFVLLSDGECNEGSVWEAVMLAGHQRLSNLTAIVDYNGLQAFGTTKEVLDLEPLVEKWRSFGWNASVVDGHDFGALIKALNQAPSEDGKPVAVIAKTVKGKGVSYMENKLEWHYLNLAPDKLEEALKELE